MKKPLISVLLAVLAAACVLGCGHAPAAETSVPAAAVEPAETPVPVLSFPGGSACRADEIRLALPDLVHRDVPETAELLKQMAELEYVDLGTDGAWTESDRAELNAETAAAERPAEATRDLTWADIQLLQAAAPQADFDYRFVFYGRYLSTLSEEIDLSHSVMSDEGAAVRELLPLMKYCKRLDMDSCGVSSEAMAKIRDDYPQMDVIWRIWFACDQFTMRTDSERLWCAAFYPYMWDEYTQELKYLTHLKYLDLGHNLQLHDWSFLRYMPDLEVLILTSSSWESLDMLENCTKLEYLEIIPYAHLDLDLHPLTGLTNLEHLNICAMGKTEGWEVLLNMKKLKRLWIGEETGYYLPEGAEEKLREALPDTEIMFRGGGAATGSWRINPDGTVPERYALLREQFDYDHWTSVAPYPYNDPKYNPPW